VWYHPWPASKPRCCNLNVLIFRDNGMIASGIANCLALDMYHSGRHIVGDSYAPSEFHSTNMRPHRAVPERNSAGWYPAFEKDRLRIWCLVDPELIVGPPVAVEGEEQHHWAHVEALFSPSTTISSTSSSARKMWYLFSVSFPTRALVWLMTFLVSLRGSILKYVAL